MDRREFLHRGLVGASGLVLGPGFWFRAYAAPATSGPGPYGALLGPDANGVRLPEGFRSRIVGDTDRPVAGTGYVWHADPDGGATFATDGGGWVYVSNSEASSGRGGVGAIRFDASGEVVDAYPILEGTTRNCAGGATPWGTWLSCEEYDRGRVWECDPLGDEEAVVRPAMGTFQHEAVAVDPEGQRLYLTEDEPDGRYYRFTPDAYPDLAAGVLEVAEVAGDDAVTWHRVPDPEASTPTRTQVAASTPFRGGEGIWYDAGFVYFTTKRDHRVWQHDLTADRITVLYDAADHDDPVLTGVDNITVDAASDLYVAEDGGDMQLVMITADDRVVAPFLQVVGHEGSEVTGPAFTPSFDRLYFSSQRGAAGDGVTFEIRGPFRGASALVRATSTTKGPVTTLASPASGATGESSSDSTPALVGGALGLAALGAIGLRARRRRARGDREDHDSVSG